MRNSAKHFLLQHQLKEMLHLNEKMELVTHHGNNLLNKKPERYRNADNETSARFPKMAQRNDVSCIVRNHYIFNLLFVKHI